jgi:hypothetical protein
MAYTRLTGRTVTTETVFTGSDPGEMYYDYICQRKTHRIRIPHEKREQLRAYLSDPTIGTETLDLLCSACNAVGTALLDPVARIIRDSGPESRLEVSIGFYKMRCATERCVALRQVLVIGNANTAGEEQKRLLAAATISAGFCCPKGHQIVGL